MNITERRLSGRFSPANLATKRLGACVAVVVLFFLSQFVRAEDVEVRFQLPLGRASHGFSLYVSYNDGAVGAWHFWSQGPGEITPKSTIEGQSTYLLNAESHLEMAFLVDSTIALNEYWLVDDTTGEYSQKNLQDLRGAPWSYGEPNVPGGGMALSTLKCFAIPIGRPGTQLLLGSDDGQFYPVTSGSEQGESVVDTNTSETVYRSYGFYTASAPTSSTAANFHLLDLADRTQAPLNATELIFSDWSPLNTPWLMHTVAIKVPDNDVGQAYTLHTWSGSLQGKVAQYLNMNHPEGGEMITGAWVVGIVGPNETFWVTRDVDGISSGERQAQLQYEVIDWTAAFGPIVHRIPIDYVFGGNRRGHSFAVHQSDGVITPVSDTISTYSLITWDNRGFPVEYPVDAMRGFIRCVDPITPPGAWLVDETTGENLGSATSFLQGWEPWHPAPPAGYMVININQSRHTHSLGIIQGDGTTWDIFTGTAPAGYGGFDHTDPYSYLTAWQVFGFGTPEEHGFEIRYFCAYVPYDPSQELTIWDYTTGEHRTFSPGDTVDLSQWYLEPQSVILNISATRWNHSLELRQATGESFAITKGNLQGAIAISPSSTTSFLSYGYFDASSMAHPGVPWWVYDSTTGEIASDNTGDLIQWHSSRSNIDSDTDGLPDWYEFILGTAISDPDSDGDGVSDYEEVVASRAPKDPSPVLTLVSPLGATLVP